MKHHVRSLSQIDWQEENVSPTAHVINPTRRTGNALVGPPGADDNVRISVNCDSEPRPRLFLEPASAICLIWRGGQRLLGFLVRKGEGVTQHATYTKNTNDWLCETVQSDTLIHLYRDLAQRSHKDSTSYSIAALHRDLDDPDTHTHTHAQQRPEGRKERWRPSEHQGGGIASVSASTTTGSGRRRTRSPPSSTTPAPQATPPWVCVFPRSRG